MKNLKRLLPYLKKYKNRLLLGFLFVTISNICSTYIPRIVGNAIDVLSSGNFNDSFIYYQIAYLLLLTLGSGLFMFLTRQTIILASRLIEYDLRYDLMNAIIYQPLDFFQKNPTGNLMAFSGNDIPAAREFIGPAIMYGANTITTFAFAFYFMASLNLEITFVAILPLPFITVATYFIGKKVHIASKHVQDEYANLTRQSQESISGARILRSYNREAHESILFNEISESYLSKNLVLARLQSLFMPALMVLVGFSIVLVLGYGGAKVIAGESTLGDLTQFFIYLTILIWPVAAIGWITNIIQRAAASAQRLGELFDNMPKEEDGKLQNIGTDISFDISFKDVSLTYNDNSPAVLKNIDLELPSSSSLGIIGGVGSGKSSLVNLIPRLYDADKGDIFIAGENIKNYSKKSLREAISFVPQDTFLFSMSIADNIRFGKPDATDEEIRQAAETAELHSEIMSFEKGYDTILGERGITLSGGQKQRTAIARALIRRPKILILDDALSAVDASTEELILRNLKSIMNNQTTIIISHRISSVRNADLIIALEDGKIIEKGNHQELIELAGYYAEINKKQQLEDEIAKM